MRSSIFLITLVFCFKLLVAIYLFKKADCINNSINTNTFLSLASGDSFSYCGAMENYIKENSFYFYNGYKKVYAGRMPVFMFHYFLLRQFFSIPTVKFIMTIINLIFEAFTIWLIYKWFIDSFRVQKHISRFLLVLLSFNFHYTYLSLFDGPESLGISSLLISIITFLYFFFREEKRMLFFSSLFATYATALKPYYGIVFVFFSVFLLLKYKTHIFKILFPLLLYTSVLLLLILPWSIRNYYIYKKFIPLTESHSGYHIASSTLSLWRLMAIIGESSEEWDKKAAGSFFNKKRETTWTLSDFYKAGIQDSSLLKEIQTDYTILVEKYSVEKDSLLTNKINKFIATYKKEHPLYFLNYLFLIKKYFFHSGSYFFPYKKNSDCSVFFDFLLKVLQSALYYLSLFLGSIGLILIIKKHYVYSIFTLFIIFLILLFPIYLKRVELRYFFPFQIFATIGMTYFYSFFKNYIKNG
jgi:hypothetical protein